MKTIDIEPIVNTIKLEPSSLESYAEWKKSQGHHIIERNNIYWQEAFKGFYQPVHIMQRLTVDQIHAFKHLHWGIRGTLIEEENQQANGSIHFYTLENLNSFDFSMFSSKRRENIRKSFRNVEFKEITDEKVLYEQGYRVFKSSIERTRHMHLADKKTYLKRCTSYLNNGDNSRMVLGAFLDDKLLAFLELCAVQNTAYLVTMMISTEALKYGVSSGLFYTSFVLCQQSPDIKEMYAGGVSLNNDETLDVFKQSMKLSLKMIPFYCKITKPVAFLLKHSKPVTYSHLVGNS